MDGNSDVGAGFVKINYRPVGKKLLSNIIRKASVSADEMDAFICKIFEYLLM